MTLVPTPTAAGPALADAPVFSRDRLIRFSDCDPAGIVFYPQYFVMFNGLVEDWFNEGLVFGGVPVGYERTVVQRRIGLPTVHLEVDFTAPSAMGDRVRLSLGVERLGGRSLTLQLRCVGLNADGTEGSGRVALRQVIVTTSLDTRRAVHMPTDIREAIAQSAGIVQ